MSPLCGIVNVNDSFSFVARRMEFTPELLNQFSDVTTFALRSAKLFHGEVVRLLFQHYHSLRFCLSTSFDPVKVDAG